MSIELQLVSTLEPVVTFLAGRIPGRAVNQYLSYEGSKLVEEQLRVRMCEVGIRLNPESEPSDDRKIDSCTIRVDAPTRISSRKVEVEGAIYSATSDDIFSFQLIRENQKWTIDDWSPVLHASYIPEELQHLTAPGFMEKHGDLIDSNLRRMTLENTATNPRPKQNKAEEGSRD